ncbi:hypothetical protein [Okeania sp.]|nr:hypothetical protein [Okeania sp.]MEB3343710.1 hypothetical protein [Okeania sp.]
MFIILSTLQSPHLPQLYNEYSTGFYITSEAATETFDIPKSIPEVE